MTKELKYNGVVYEIPDNATNDMIKKKFGLSSSNERKDFNPFVINDPEAQKELDYIGQGLSDPKNYPRFAKGVMQGLINTPTDILNLPIQLVNFLNKSNFSTIPRIKFTDDMPASELGDISSGLIPIGSALPKASNALKDIMEAVLKGSSNKLGKIASSISPTSLAGKILQSPLTKEQLERNLEATGESFTDLGSVIESPNLQRLQQNLLSKVPFSGSETALHHTANDILTKGENIVNQYLGDVHPLDVSDKLGESLINAKNEQTKIKNILYEEPEKIASMSGFKLKLPDFSDKMQEYGESLLQSTIFDFEPKIKNIVKSLAKGNNVKNLSLKEANIMAGKLRELSNQYGSSSNIGDRNAARILGDISRTLKSDITTEIKNSNNKELINSFNEAEKNYKENYSPFLEKDIHKFTSGKKLPEDLVASFLKTSNTSDKAEQLEKLFKVLPEKDHDLVRYSYLSRALEGSEDSKIVNPNKLKTLWVKLGDKQKRLLIPDDSQRRQIDNFVNLVSKNSKAVNKMLNPQTGQMNMDIVTAIMALHPITSLKDLFIGRSLNSLLTNPEKRKKIVGKIIERKTKGINE